MKRKTYTPKELKAARVIGFNEGYAAAMRDAYRWLVTKIKIEEKKK